MKIRVLLFAAARDAVGRDSLELDASEGLTVSGLRARVLEAAPRLQPLAQSLLWAVNNEYAGDDRVINASDSVACFPPVSGG